MVKHQKNCARYIPFKTSVVFTTNTPSHGAAAAEEPYNGKTNTVFAFAATVKIQATLIKLCN